MHSYQYFIVLREGFFDLLVLQNIGRPVSCVNNRFHLAPQVLLVLARRLDVIDAHHLQLKLSRFRNPECMNTSQSLEQLMAIRVSYQMYEDQSADRSVQELTPPADVRDK
jgi:hypothetical protein